MWEREVAWGDWGLATAGQGGNQAAGGFPGRGNGVERPVCGELGEGGGTVDCKAWEPLRVVVSASIVQWRTVDDGHSLRASVATQGANGAGDRGCGSGGWRCGGFQSEPL